jgi:hypothetical protein
MRKRNRLWAFVAFPVLAFGLAAQGTDQAPADQQAAQPIKVAEHFSRWDYPREANPGPTQQLHTVVKGDTLWDLGAKYLGNPFAWPQIWELNKWIKDPHWIYPGDPIIVEASRSTVPQQGEETLAPQEVSAMQPEFRRGPLNQGELAFSFQDFLEEPYLVPTTAEAYFKSVGALKIVSKADKTRDMVANGEVIYLNGGSNQGVKPGDRLVATTVVQRKFYDPDDLTQHKPLGDILQQEGIVRVTRVYPNQCTAVIEHAMDGIWNGDYAVPYTEPATIPNALRTDIATPIPIKQPVTRILYIREGKAVAGGGDMVIVDRGDKDGFKVGDVLLSARPSVLEPDAKTGSEVSNNYLGQMIVIRSSDRYATCRILRSNEEVLVGDVLTH